MILLLSLLNQKRYWNYLNKKFNSLILKVRVPVVLVKVRHFLIYKLYYEKTTKFI
jgi:hypothetical protein